MCRRVAKNATTASDGSGNHQRDPTYSTTVLTPPGKTVTPCERRSCVQDEGRSFAVGWQNQTANQFELRRLRAAVVNVERKGAAISRQIRSAKANESEPLMKGRNNIQTRSKPGYDVNSGINGGVALQAAATTSGLEAARAWNRLEHGTFEPVVPMRRERPKRGNREGLSTHAGHRDGTIRSCVERPVTGREPRGRIIMPTANRPTPSHRLCRRHCR